MNPSPPRTSPRSAAHLRSVLAGPSLVVIVVLAVLCGLVTVGLYRAPSTPPPHDQASLPGLGARVPGRSAAEDAHAHAGASWSTPTASVAAAPAALLRAAGVPGSASKFPAHVDAAGAGPGAGPGAGVGAWSGGVRVVSVADVAGRPAIRVARASSRAGAVAALEAAQAGPGVVAVSVDSRVRALGVADPQLDAQWGLAALDAPQVWLRGSGAGAVVAVVDTGIDATHEDLAGQVLPGAEFVDGGGRQTVGDGRRDPHGHGTHVAGIVAAVKGNGLGGAGLAPTASLLPVRVLSADGSGWNSDIAAGIVWAADHGASVVNLSLGGPAADAVTQAAVAYAVAHGVIVVAAAGNSRDRGNQASYPGAYPGVVAVGAVDSDLRAAPFSTTGAYVDVAAPGVGVLSTVPGSGYEQMSGTSMAAPFVTAVAAIAVGLDSRVGPASFEAAVTSTADDLGPAGRDSEFGAGLVDPRAAVCALVGCDAGPHDPTPPPPPPPPGQSGVAASLRVSGPDGFAFAGEQRTFSVSLLEAASGRPLAGVPVRVRVATAGGAGVRWVRTDAAGSATFKVRLSATATLSVSSSRTAAARPARGSRVLRVRVYPRVSVTYSGAAATATVARPRGQVVSYQQQVGGEWVTRRRLGLPHAGRGAAAVRDLPAGTWRVHVSAAGGLEALDSGVWSVS